MQTKPELFIHPELRVGEVFFINSSLALFRIMEWKTKRKGKTAYDGKGNKQNARDWFPIFISTAELETKGKELQKIRREWREKFSPQNANNRV